jgi:hypothetical protein
MNAGSTLPLFAIHIPRTQGGCFSFDTEGSTPCQRSVTSPQEEPVQLSKKSHTAPGSTTITSPQSAGSQRPTASGGAYARVFRCSARVPLVRSPCFAVPLSNLAQGE